MSEEQREKSLHKSIAASGREASKVLRKSQKVIKGTIADYTSKSNFLSNAATRNRLYKEIQAEYRVLDSHMDDWITGNVKSTSKNWWNYAKEDMPKGAVKGTFNQFSEKYVEDIIGIINPSTMAGQVAINAQIGGMATNDIRTLRAAVSTTMLEGSVEGLTRPQMSARMLQKAIKETGEFKFIDKGGRAWTADNYFGMLNRTMHASAARQSYVDVTSKELGYDLYQIEGGVTGSSVEYPNDPCDNWAGRIISMTGDTKGYPTYNDALAAGVFHPNCTHFVRALLPSEVPEAKEQQAEERKIAKELDE